MGRVGVPEFVRFDVGIELSAGAFDGALDRTFEKPVTDCLASARVPAGIAEREQVGPLPGEAGGGVFLRHAVRQGNRQGIGFITVPYGAGGSELGGQVGDEGARQGDDAVFVALGATDHEKAVGEVHIADAEIAGFTDSQTTTVQESDGKVGGVAVGIGDGVDQLADFCHGWGTAKMLAAFGAQGVDLGEFAPQAFPVKEQDGVESLILG